MLYQENLLCAFIFVFFFKWKLIDFVFRTSILQLHTRDINEHLYSFQYIYLSIIPCLVITFICKLNQHI